MGVEKPFAAVEDYEARYGEAADASRVSTLLDDASAMLMSAYEARWGEYEAGAHKAFDRSVAAVACSIVNRALSVPDGMAGATQYSEAAGPYNASVTFANPTADLWLGRSDLKRLGMSGGRIGFIGAVSGDVQPHNA